METESSGQRQVKVNNTGGQGSRRAVAPSDDDAVLPTAATTYIVQMSTQVADSL
jgi:hypothetical protein